MKITHFPGTYRKWARERVIRPGLHGQKRLHFVGLAQALDDGLRTDAVLTINGGIVFGWKREGDRIMLPAATPAGTWLVKFEITYSDLAPTTVTYL